jgi:hypothetical protein
VAFHPKSYQKVDLTATYISKYNLLLLKSTQDAPKQMINEKYSSCSTGTGGIQIMM